MNTTRTPSQTRAHSCNHLHTRTIAVTVQLSISQIVTAHNYTRSKRKYISIAIEKTHFNCNLEA